MGEKTEYEEIQIMKNYSKSSPSIILFFSREFWVSSFSARILTKLVKVNISWKLKLKISVCIKLAIEVKGGRSAVC